MTMEFPLAFDLADNVAEWPEIALAVAIAFLGASLVTTLLSRMARWSLHNLLLSAASRKHLQVNPKAFQQPIRWIRLVVFVLAWAILSLPLLNVIGLPLDLGERHAMRRWLLTSGVRIVLIVVVSLLVLRIARDDERAAGGTSSPHPAATWT